MYEELFLELSQQPRQFLYTFTKHLNVHFFKISPKVKRLYYNHEYQKGYFQRIIGTLCFLWLVVGYFLLIKPWESSCTLEIAMYVGMYSLQILFILLIFIFLQRSKAYLRQHNTGFETMQFLMVYLAKRALRAIRRKPRDEEDSLRAPNYYIATSAFLIRSTVYGLLLLSLADAVVFNSTDLSLLASVFLPIYSIITVVSTAESAIHIVVANLVTAVNLGFSSKAQSFNAEGFLRVRHLFIPSLRSVNLEMPPLSQTEIPYRIILSFLTLLELLLQQYISSKRRAEWIQYLFTVVDTINSQQLLLNSMPPLYLNKWVDVLTSGQATHDPVVPEKDSHSQSKIDASNSSAHSSARSSVRSFERGLLTGRTYKRPLSQKTHREAVLRPQALNLAANQEFGAIFFISTDISAVHSSKQHEFLSRWFVLLDFLSMVLEVEKLKTCGSTYIVSFFLRDQERQYMYSRYKQHPGSSFSTIGESDWLRDFLKNSDLLLHPAERILQQQVSKIVVFCLLANELLQYFLSMPENHSIGFPWLKMGGFVGDVSCCVIGRDKLTFDVFGTTVNSAARLAFAAKPPSLLVSSEIWTIVRPLLRKHVRSINLGFCKYKGLSRPVHTIQLVSVRRFHDIDEALSSERICSQLKSNSADNILFPASLQAEAYHISAREASEEHCTLQITKNNIINEIIAAEFLADPTHIPLFFGDLILLVLDDNSFTEASRLRKLENLFASVTLMLDIKYSVNIWQSDETSPIRATKNPYFMQPDSSFSADKQFPLTSFTSNTSLKTTSRDPQRDSETTHTQDSSIRHHGSSVSKPFAEATSSMQIYSKFMTSKYKKHISTNSTSLNTPHKVLHEEKETTVHSSTHELDAQETQSLLKSFSSDDDIQSSRIEASQQRLERSISHISHFTMRPPIEGAVDSEAESVSDLSSQFSPKPEGSDACSSRSLQLWEDKQLNSSYSTHSPVVSYCDLKKEKKSSGTEDTYATDSKSTVLTWMSDAISDCAVPNSILSSHASVIPPLRVHSRHGSISEGAQGKNSGSGHFIFSESPSLNVELEASANEEIYIPSRVSLIFLKYMILLNKLQFFVGNGMDSSQSVIWETLETMSKNNYFSTIVSAIFPFISTVLLFYFDGVPRGIYIFHYATIMVLIQLTVLGDFLLKKYFSRFFNRCLQTRSASFEHSALDPVLLDSLLKRCFLGGIFWTLLLVLEIFFQMFIFEIHLQDASEESFDVAELTVLNFYTHSPLNVFGGIAFTLLFFFKVFIFENNTALSLIFACIVALEFSVFSLFSNSFDISLGVITLLLGIVAFVRSQERVSFTNDLRLTKAFLYETVNLFRSLFPHSILKTMFRAQHVELLGIVVKRKRRHRRDNPVLDALSSRAEPIILAMESTSDSESPAYPLPHTCPFYKRYSLIPPLLESRSACAALLEKRTAEIPFIVAIKAPELLTGKLPDDDTELDAMLSKTLETDSFQKAVKFFPHVSKIDENSSSRFILQYFRASIDALAFNVNSVCRGSSSATVVYSDIVSFTNICSHITPGEIVALLYPLFREFDAACKRHGLEKIKTVGDAYQAVGGLTKRSDTMHLQAIRFAQDIIKISQSMTMETHVPLHIRVGVATGPVIGQVVGVLRPRYDVFGPAVERAEHLESRGAIGYIHADTTTARLLDGSDEFIAEPFSTLHALEWASRDPPMHAPRMDDRSHAHAVAQTFNIFSRASK
eukprot:gnl/Chilomastix_cuspidata/2517.p1 GENE.gnl/Chilomastix_cuspidata/2517~~gnl/Chilomastix_cuspidata/2517.p1  ORF type:complete len:1710 (-),score=196.28 gnl/Chilomastix_cuspidata/2517:1057-6186(-)